ncbi:ArsO family NAD(P)H-dependent flavin-containing monooxygenase [Aureivirga sp. CE67]|uniref:ArsO family NAD(P)H-dependent flavin-containing monooxygenase n=1 Tax=Aureivirga sp. CE67 TaxID=1788983 RepID=UPI0018CBE434|nr:ArsO family NAD(P)H-dependent flavin-containing monooxygenase [Aureivirga sp. CE67]
MKIYDVIVIGGGQSGLSVGYFLRRYKLDYLILDSEEKAGGAWQYTWDSLKLFSPVQFSSLSGWGMPEGENEYPTKNEFIEYLKAYEKRYDFPVQRNVEVHEVLKENDVFKLKTNNGEFYTKTLVSATGTAKNSFIPKYKNDEKYLGKQIHSVTYKNEEAFRDKKVIIIGGGNSGAQILAEVSKVAKTKWVTLEEPFFLPEEIDGRYLFNEATRKFYNQPSKELAGISSEKISLNNIVQVESVREAKQRDVFHAVRPFKEFYEEGVVWENGEKEKIDAVIWCTGFKANLKHLDSLGISNNHKIETEQTRALKEPALWLVGFGSWTGFASATIYGVGKTAKRTAAEISEFLKEA